MQHVTRLANYFRSLQGWKAYAMAFALGVALTAAFPPFWALPLGILAFSGWLWLLQGVHGRKGRFAIGWWFGFGHHTTGLYWICIALGVDGGAFWWMMPFALCLLPAYLALYTGALGLLLRQRVLPPTQQVALFGLLWLVLEYIRAHLFYGFPWNLAGYIWTISDVTLQPASVFGIYGMSLWAVLFCGAFSLLAKPLVEVQPDNRLRGFAVIMAASLALLLWGAVRLQQADTLVEPSSGANVRIVQANVAQSLKWDPAFQLEALQRHINLSNRPAEEGFAPDYIVWPETAMPYSLERGSRWHSLLAKVAPEQGRLLTGNVRHVGEGETWQVWNSLRVIAPDADIRASYDKHMLVPFGEFVPLRSVLSFLPMDKITQGSTDFTAGQGAELLDIAGDAPQVQPLICYEAIFPEFRTDDMEERPEWLLNITNDAWFGTSTGPYQHLHMTRTRAVERGIPLLRAANTGVSAAFDAFGRMLAHIPLNSANIVDVALPARTIAPTWYSRHGELTLIIICYILFIYIFMSRRKNT